MKGLIITHKNFEKFAGEEVKALIGKSCTVEESVVKFDADQKELIKVTYKTQTANRVLELIDEFDIKEMEDRFKKLPEKINLIDQFKVECERIGEHDFKSNDIEKQLGTILDESDEEKKVNLSSPKQIIFVYIYNNKCYVGYDMAGSDLSKRDYKVFIHPASLKGNIAAAMLYVAGYRSDKVLVDPFSGSGIIPIEAALMSANISHNFYSKRKLLYSKTTDSAELRKYYEEFDEKKTFTGKIVGYDYLLKHLKAAKKNAKVADVNDLIEFSKVELSWLDSKFEEGDIDMIVTDIPKFTKFTKENGYKGLAKEIFYQAEFVIKKGGNITLLINEKSVPFIREAVEKYKFKEELELHTNTGETDIVILKYKRI